MKILHVTPSCFPATYYGGPIFTVYALNRALAAMQGVSLTMLTTDTAGPGRRLDAARTSALHPGQQVVMTVRVAGVSVSPALLWHLPALVRRADVVHLTGIYSFPTIPTLLVCRLLGKPLVWSPRGAIQDAQEWGGSRRRRLKRAWEKICNALVIEGKVVAHATSERERVATQMRLPRTKAVVIPNGVDVPEELHARDWLPGGRLRLMYLGRLSPKKGLENLLSAMAQLGDSNVQLTVYGEGDEPYAASLKNLASRLGMLDKTIFFAGQADAEEKEQAFSLADVCIIPSYTESFCMVVAEALSHGVPVIASTGTPWEAIEEKQCGLWVDNSPEELARAIGEIRKMDLARMGECGWNWMRREFSWDCVAAEMMRVYRVPLADKG